MAAAVASIPISNERVSEVDMERSTNRSGTKQEDGIALLMAIFVLLVISVVAISMIVASGTETALAGNYRNAGNAYYAAVAGLEEGRGRMRTIPITTAPPTFHP